MSKECVNVNLKDITRAFIIVEIKSETYPDLNTLITFSRELSNLLNSTLLNSCYTEFPSNLDGVKNYTLLSVLSTSHIAISTYFSRDEKYIDIEVSWCSKTSLKEEELRSLVRKCFGDCRISVKVLDFLGNVIKQF